MLGPNQFETRDVMTGDYLYQQEMLRKGIRNSIIWIVFVILFVGALYGASFFLIKDSEKDHFQNQKQDIKRLFHVQLYACPVDIEIEIVGEGNATILLIPASEDGKPNPETIAYVNDSRYFRFEEELEAGDYYIIVKHVPQDTYDDKSKVHYISLDVYILKPFLVYIFIGAGVIELLPVIWLVSVIVRRRNLTKEMIIASSKGTGSTNNYYDSLYGDREASKHTAYDDLYPRDGVMTDHEKSKMAQHENNLDSLYSRDYELRKRKRPSQVEDIAPGETGMEDFIDFKAGPGESRSNPGRARKKYRSRGRGGEKSRKRERDAPRPQAPIRRGTKAKAYDIDYIPPGAGDRKPAGKRSVDRSPSVQSHSPRKRYRKTESDIHWGGEDGDSDGNGSIDYDDY